MLIKKAYLKVPYFKYLLLNTAFIVLYFFSLNNISYVFYQSIHKMNIKHSLLEIYTSKRADGLDIGAVILLKELQDKKSYSIDEIKLLLRISNTKLKKIMYQLASKNFIETTRDSLDGRRKLVSISSKGKDFIDNLY